MSLEPDSCLVFPTTGDTPNCRLSRVTDSAKFSLAMAGQLTIIRVSVNAGGRLLPESALRVQNIPVCKS